MADRTQLKAADHNDIAADDPFAELTRIMGFDPRQPVRQSPAVEKVAPANQSAAEADFDIDLEKELMGEFGAVEEGEFSGYEPATHESVFETASAPASDDEIAASFEQDFVFDDAADHLDGHFATARAPEPAAGIAVDDDFDLDDNLNRALASSLEVAPAEDDLPIDQEMAASLDEGFELGRHETDTGHAEVAEPGEPVAEAGLDADFDNAVEMSLEDELAFDNHEPEHLVAAEDEHLATAEEQPAEAYAVADQLISDEDLTGHFDEAMVDVDMDLGQHQDLPQEPEPPLDDEQAPAEPAAAVHYAAEPEAAADPVTEAADQDFEDEFELDVHDVLHEEPAGPDVEPVADTVDQSSEDEFELSFRGALQDEPEVPAVEAVAAAQPSFEAPVAPAPAPQIAAVEPANAAAAGERSLEDELNALLGAMTARPISVAREAAEAPRLVAQPASHADQKAASADDLDEHEAEPVATQNDQAAQPADDLDALLAGELDRQDIEAAAPADGEPRIDFDDDAFDAAFAKGIEADQLHSTPAEPSRSWSRSTPTTAPAQASFVAQPAPAAPQMAAAPAYRSEPSQDYSAYTKPAPVPQAYDQEEPQAYHQEEPQAYRQEEPQARHQEDVPDVETVDVPERVVALADDLDIPELNFEEDQPAAPAYDDLDAEFASLLTEMNSTEIAPATTSSRGYEDDSYNAGFKTGYDRRELRAETPAAPATASQPAAATDFDADDLPGSRPVSQADDFAVDELDYDPELDEAMTVPGLAEQEAARPRRRGFMIAALVGAVAIAGGLGALAFSFGGKGGGEAPVIVKADNSPIKVKPENPGGAVVPNQDSKVYDAVVKGGAAKSAEPTQQKLVTNTEEPVDLASKEPPQSRVVDLTPDDTAAAPGTEAAANPDAAAPDSDQAAAPASAQPAAPESAQPAAPAPKSEDRIAQVLQDADKGTNTDVVAVAPRKVKTMMVKADGSLVQREDPAPAAPQVAAAEPTDPAPQHVAPAGQADGQQTGTVAADQPADQADADQDEALKPTTAAKPKAEAKAQSSNTPAKVPVAPPRPSDQPVDIVGEVKPDQVASIDPATPSAGGGSWSMQIASQPTVESAQSTYQDLQRRYGSVLAGHTANIVKAEIAGKGTFYRVRVPAQSRNDAINLCTSYKAAGGNCFVSR